MAEVGNFNDQDKLNSAYIPNERFGLRCTSLKGFAARWFTSGSPYVKPLQTAWKVANGKITNRTCIFDPLEQRKIMQLIKQNNKTKHRKEVYQSLWYYMRYLVILISTPFTMVHICTEKPFLRCGHGPKESHEAYVSSLNKPFRLIGSMFYN